MKTASEYVNETISKPTLSRAWDATSHHPERRAARYLEDTISTLETLEAKIRAVANEAGRPEWADDEIEVVRRAYMQRVNAHIHACSRCLSSFIVGPARFPVRRAEKANQSEHNRSMELDAFVKGAPNKARKRFKRRNADILGGAGMRNAELDDAKARLEERERRQAHMVKVNKILRRALKVEEDNRAEALAQMLNDAGEPSDMRFVGVLLKPNYMGKICGYESYSLQNNNAEIRRLKNRVAMLERKAAKAEAVEAGDAQNSERTVGDIRIVENAELDRLQLIFPGKPSSEVRRVLKSGGYRWSPREGAWQRQLTNNARYCLDHVLKQIAQLEAA